MKKRNFKRILAGVVSLSMAMSAFGFVSDNGSLKDNMTVVQAVAAQEKTVTWDSSVLNNIFLVNDGQTYVDSLNGITVTCNRPNDGYPGEWMGEEMAWERGNHPVFTCSAGVIKKIAFSAEHIMAYDLGTGWGDIEHGYVFTDDDDFRASFTLTWSGSSDSVSLESKYDDNLVYMSRISSIVFTIEEGGSGSGSGTQEESHDYNITDLVQGELTSFPEGYNWYYNNTDATIYFYQSADGVNYWFTNQAEVRLPVTIENVEFTVGPRTFVPGQGIGFTTTNQKYYIGTPAPSTHNNTYTLTIPSTATASDSGFNEIGNIEISAGDIDATKKIVITPEGSEFRNTDTSITTTIGYTVEVATDNGSTPITDGLTVSAADANAGYSKKVGLNINEQQYDAAEDGEYKTIITWTAKIVNN